MLIVFADITCISLPCRRLLCWYHCCVIPDTSDYEITWWVKNTCTLITSDGPLFPRSSIEPFINVGHDSAQGSMSPVLACWCKLVHINNNGHLSIAGLGRSLLYPIWIQYCIHSILDRSSVRLLLLRQPMGLSSWLLIIKDWLFPFLDRKCTDSAST